MSNRVNALVITLDQDIREDDVETIINAIRMIRHVEDVSVNVTNMTDHVAYVRARSHIATKLWDALKD